MKKVNLKTNAILNVIKTSLAIVFPLITYPYAIRTIGVDGLGKVSFSSSIVNYFSLIAMLGVTTYGVREGAKIRDDRNKLNVFICEILTINILSTIFSVCLLIATLLVFQKLHGYRMLILLQSTSFVFTAIGMDWINNVFEEFKRITIRSIITYLISLGLLFVIVKTPDDYYEYALLPSVTNLIICLTNFYYVYKKIHLKFAVSANIWRHIKPLLILFANAIAIMVYVSIDKTMLGLFKGDYDVGLYTIPARIYHTLKVVLAAIYAVAIPRLALYISQTNHDQYKKTFSSLCSYLTTILIPCCTGLACVSYDLLYVLGGGDAVGGTVSLQFLSGGLLFAIYGGLITAVLNITLNRERFNLFATVLSAVMNFGLNFYFIPRFSLNGAAVTTLLSELLVLVLCLYLDRDAIHLINIKKVFVSIFQASLGSALIVMAYYLVHQLNASALIRLIITIPLCAVTYTVLMIAVKNECAIWAFAYVRDKLFPQMKSTVAR